MIDRISLGGWVVILSLSIAGILWMMWLDRPKKTPPASSAPRYINGCGAAARFCDSHTCRCAWPECDGNHHVCLCGADWSSQPREEVKCPRTPSS